MRSNADSDRTYEDWFRARVQAALDDPRPNLAHEQVMTAARARLEARLTGGAGGDLGDDMDK